MNTEETKYSDSEKLIHSDHNIHGNHENDHLKHEREVEDKIKNLTTKKIVGYLLLLFVILISVLSSIWIKYITTDVKPFLMTYINYSFLSLLILINMAKNKIKECAKKTNEETEENNITNIEKESVEEKEGNYQAKFHFMCIVLMVFWYFGNAFYNMGLTKTSVTSSNTLSNVSIVFILLEKAVIFKSKCSAYRIIGLVACVGGIVLMALFEATIKKDTKTDSMFGDSSIIIGAFAYSLYAVSIKYFSKKHENHFDMMEVFGYIGLYNFLLVPIVLLIFHFTSIEVIELPSLTSLLYIFINALIAGFVADLSQSYCVILLSPHIVSFGLILTAPLSYLYDSLLGNIQLNYYYLGGSVLIVAAFCLIFFENYKKIQSKKERLQKQKEEDFSETKDDEIKENNNVVNIASTV